MLLGQGLDTSGVCLEGPEAFRRVIAEGEAYLARATDGRRRALAHYRDAFALAPELARSGGAREEAWRLVVGLAPAPERGPLFPILLVEISSMSAHTVIRSQMGRGIGHVYAVVHERADSIPELVVRSDTSDAAPVLAVLDVWRWRRPGHEDERPLYAAAEPGLKGEIARVTHDDYGLEVDRVAESWVRVAYTAEGEPRRGRVRLVPGRIEYLGYEERIRNRIVWFEQPEEVVFYRQPGGEPVEFPLVTSRRDATEAVPSYTLEVLEVDGEWAKVRVTIPDVSACTGDPDADVLRSEELWVRLRDSQGRLRINDAPAGC